MSIQNIGYSELEALIEKGKIKNVYDLHKETAARDLGKSIEDVTPEERARAKEKNFLNMYSNNSLTK